jgi:hypothetical protein
MNALNAYNFLFIKTIYSSFMAPPKHKLNPFRLKVMASLTIDRLVTRVASKRCIQIVILFSH